MRKYFTLSLLLSLFLSAFSQVRYVDSLFRELKHTDINYGSNYDNKNQLTQLLMDVYEPEGDTVSLRPIIFFVHGGSFIGGSRTDQSINKTAEFFCRKGYVSANIEYRVEQTTLITPYLDFGDWGNFYRAIVRVTHDLKAAIRYIKKDAALNGNPYKVDTTKIFIYGSSAGAIGGLTAVFLDDTAEMSDRFKIVYRELGGLDGNSGNPGYDIKGIKAIVSCSGAMDNINYLNNNTDISYLGFHNNPDLVVPFDIGCFTTVFCHLGYFYGDNRLFPKAKSLGMNTAFYPINKLGHPVDEYDDTATHRFILETTRDFLYRIVSGSVVTVVSNRNVKNIELFPNPSNGDFILNVPDEVNTKESIIEISSTDGRVVYTEPVTHKGQVHLQVKLPDGLYFLSIKTEGETYLSKINIHNRY
jgi:hypothetical protein